MVVLEELLQLRADVKVSERVRVPQKASHNFDEIGSDGRKSWSCRDL